MKKIISVFIASVILCGWGVNASVLKDDDSYKSVVVQENDTLWDIAARETSDRVDVRKYVYTVQKLNHITDPGNLVPGQRINLPVIYK